MRKNKIDKVYPDENKNLTRKGESIYYIGTLLFIAGSILLAFGAGSIIFYQINYNSETQVVLYTVLLIGIGLLLLSLGINLMVRQNKKSYYAIAFGTILTIISILLFYFNYETNWFYPIISYVLLLYLSGLILLLGNAFGNVTLWLIFNQPQAATTKEKVDMREYTDEEIAKDIDDAIKKSLQRAADEIQFNLADTKKLKVGSAAANSEFIVKVRDDMTEAHSLGQAINPGYREEWGVMGVDKASNQLAEALQHKPVKRKGFLSFFKK